MISEEHIVIGKDRHITVPEALRRIAVQYDHNIETVTFDCPRYWDEHDMSKMTIYIAYMRKDRYRDKDVAENIAIDDSDPNLMHFTWTVSKNATMVKGELKILVCIVQVDDDGNEVVHWNSELNNQMYVSEGMECNDYVVTLYSDVITDLLVRMDNILIANTPILDQSLTIHGLAADAKHTGDAIDKVQSNLDSAVYELTNSIETETNTLSKQITENTDDLADAIRTEATTRQYEIDVQRKRIDKLASLTAGSTTGDAELQDTRIGFNGVEYDSAGEAVREQIELAHDHIASVAKKNPHNLFDPLYAISNTGFASETGEYLVAAEYWVTPKMNITGLSRLFCNRRAYKYAFYDISGTYLPDSSTAVESGNLDPIAIPDNVGYIMMQFAVAVTPFEDRFDVVCCDFNHAYEESERQYRIDPSVIDGPLKLVPGMFKEDTRNLFDPLKASDNMAFATEDGVVHVNEEFWSTHFIDVGSYSYVVTDKRPYKYGWYDENLTILDVTPPSEITDTYIQKFVRPADAKYLRIVYSKNLIPFEDRFDIVICPNTELFSTIKPRYYIHEDNSAFLNIWNVDHNNLFDPVQARNDTCFETASGACFANTKYWVTDFISVKGISGIKCNTSIYKFAWYDANKEVIQINGTTAPEGAEYAMFQFEQSVVAYEDRFKVIICDESLEIDNVRYHYYLPRKCRNELKLLGDHRFSFPLTNPTYMSDHTFINGKLYVVNASNDDHTDTNNVTVYTVNNESGAATYEKTFTHNLGHCNSIDYCAGNDCLIMGNGSSDESLPGEIYILKNPAERESWRYEDCVVINVSGENWGFKTNVVWGEHNNGQYNIIYVITNNNANVRKLLLTKTNGEFNGGYVLLDSWETDTIDVNQGSVYRNGKLYMTIGHAQVWLLEYTLKPGGVIDIQEYKDIFYDESGAVLMTPFSEGITIENGYVYIGTWDNVTGHIQVYKYWG